MRVLTFSSSIFSDLEDLVANDTKQDKKDKVDSTEPDGENIAYDYFVAYKTNNNTILDYMNPKDAVELIFQVADNIGKKYGCDSDNDSEDSNRESADGNDYPEDASDYDDEDDEYEGRRRNRSYGGSDDSDDSDRRRNNRRMHDSDSDDDEEEAARRYNQKQKTKHRVLQGGFNRDFM